MNRIRAAVLSMLLACAATAQTVVPTLDEKEAAGERPYEMLWARRVEPAPPTIRFDRLDDWRIEAQEGAEAVLQLSQSQNIWDRPVSRLRYRGDGKSSAKPRIVIYPPSPVPLPADADSVDLWIFGNRWDWENPPDTPALRLILSLRDADGKQHDVAAGNIRWKEWWLAHKKLPNGLKPPVRLESIAAEGGWQAAWREIFFDSIQFYREDLPPLKFAARPKRNLNLFDGQSPGANTGPGKLAFPTREQTILPLHLAGRFQNEVRRIDGKFLFIYRGDDCLIYYRFVPEKGLNGMSAMFRN
ncbi:MAG: hypothetical protein HYY23_17295, partial [Verrucomicrobia bacterium]|nr:hypothetical protein [Verrucomicrobiota bacterium]